MPTGSGETQALPTFQRRSTSRHLLNAVQTPGFGTVQGADKVPYFAHLFGLGRPRVFAHKHVSTAARCLSPSFRTSISEALTISSSVVVGVGSSAN